jgi:DNA-binding transcriptional ArsR family regulator
MTISPATPETAALFHALSDPTRLAIVARLRGGERCVCDLTDLLDAAQSRLSFHLKPNAAVRGWPKPSTMPASASILRSGATSSCPTTCI